MVDDWVELVTERAKLAPCVHLALIVRHILPKADQAAFKKWLTTVLTKRIGKP